MTTTAAGTTGRIFARPMRNDEDFWRVHRLLVETVPLAPRGFNWDVRRWEGFRFYNADPAWNPRWEAQTCLWETEDGRVVGAVHTEDLGSAYLELHPDYRHLEADMLAWAEEHLAAPTADGAGRRLDVFAYEYDLPRRRLLDRRGYEKQPEYGCVRRLRFGHAPLPRPSVAEGYTLRTTRPEEPRDCQHIADLLNAAFGRAFHNAREYEVFTRLAPSFRNDLDLVAEAPDGSFAAYVGIPYDAANRRGIFEPVCTHPDHRRRGLARALMLEGLRRLNALGAADATVGTGDMVPANQLYDSVGFTEIYVGHVWRRLS